MSTTLNFDIGARYREAQTAFSTLTGSADKFQRKLNDLDRTRANPEVDLVLKEAQRDLAKFKAELENLKNVKLKVDADVAKANASISSVERELKKLKDEPTSVEVTARTAIAEARLKQLKAERDKLKDVRLTVTADIAQANSNIAGLNSNIGRLERDIATRLTVNADTDTADRNVGAFATRMRSRLTAAINALPDIEITANSSDVDRRIAAIRAQLLSLVDPEITPDFNDAGVRAQIAALSAQLRLLSTQDVDIEANFNATAALAQMAVLRRMMSDTGQQGSVLFRILGGGVSALGSLVGATTRAGSAMTSLGTSIAGVGGGAVEASSSFKRMSLHTAMLVTSLASLVVSLPLIAGAIGVAVAGIGQLGGAVVALVSGIVPLVGLLGTLPGLLIPVGIAAGALAIAFGDEGLKRELENTKKAFEPLVNDIRNQLRPALTQLLGAVNQLVPVFQRVAPVITGALSDVARGFSTILRSSSFKSDLEELMRSSGATIRGLGTAFQSVFLGLTDMAIAAQPAVASLVGLIQDGAAKFREFMAEGRRTGELATFFQQGVDVLRQLMGVLGNITGLFKDLWDSAHSSGAFVAVLGSINSGITRMRDYVNDAGGAWDRLMIRVRDVSDDIIGLLGDIADAFVQIGADVDLKPAIDGIRSLIQGLIPFFKDVGQALSDSIAAVGPVLGDVLREWGPEAGNAIRGITITFLELLEIVDELATRTQAFFTFFRSPTEANKMLDDLAVRGQRSMEAIERLKAGMDSVPPSASRAAESLSGVGEAIEQIPAERSIGLNVEAGAALGKANAVGNAVLGIPQNWLTKFEGDPAGLNAAISQATGGISAVDPEHWTGFFGDTGNILDAAGVATGAANSVPQPPQSVFTGDPNPAVAAAGMATGAINGVPDRKDTRINAETNADSVVDSVRRWLNGIHGHTVTTFIDTVRRFFGAGGMIMSDGAVAMASGGLLPMAEGDALDRMRPMSGRTARIVPPRTLRVIGDRMVDDEAFIPINDSPWSTAILGETARRKGFALMPMAGGRVLQEDDPGWVDPYPHHRPTGGNYAHNVASGAFGAPGTRHPSDPGWDLTGQIPRGPDGSTSSIGFSLSAMAHGGINRQGPVIYGSVSEREWRRLKAAGWRGDPNDGMEALYPPSRGGSRDERAWEWIRQLLERYRGGGAGGPGAGPAGPSAQLPQATLRTMYQTSAGMASLTRSNPAYAPLMTQSGLPSSGRTGGAVRVNLSDLSFRLTGNRFMDTLLEEIAHAIRSRGGDPQVMYSRR